MRIRFHRTFKKSYQRLTKNQQKKFQERLEVFLNDQFNPTLRNHPLKGKYLDYRSINISGDLRAIYKYISSKECVFVVLGRHRDLYK